MTEVPQGTRAQMIENWTRELDDENRLSRRFSGERIKRLVKADWPAKAAFAAITVGIVLFIFFHGSKDDRLRAKEARAAALSDEPSVRDFNPPVMPEEKELSSLKPTAPSSNETHAPTDTADDEKRMALEEARTKSDILVEATNPQASITSGPTSPMSVASLDASFSTIKASAVTANGQPEDPNDAFKERITNGMASIAIAARMSGLNCTALQGKVIDAELETAIDSDLPGQVRAIVSSPLYAEEGQEVLLTPGSRLVGVYNTAVRKGQVRVFVVWKRAIRPDGVEVDLNSPATDTLGEAGLSGDTDNHFMQIFGMSALLSVIGAGAETVNNDASSPYTATDQYRIGLQQGFAQTSNRVLEPYSSIPPTISVHQGERISIFLNHDLNFCGVRAAASKQAELVLP